MGEQSNNNTALAVREGGEIQRAADYLPVMNMAEAKARRDAMIHYVQEIMVKDKDYGVIPGTGDKPTLMKPGAEKLLTFFGLRSDFEIVRETEDWQNGFFYYWYKCRLFRGEVCIAEGEGSCSSMESKYRWRKAERKCPRCGAPAIIKGKAEYGGGYVCFKKKGGCDAKFRDGDPAIESQPVGRVANPDIYDQVNTLQKMAQKRALVAATLIGVNASEFFTQDIEDMVVDAEAEPSRYEEPAPRREEPSPEEVAAAEAKHKRERAAKVDKVLEIVSGCMEDAAAYLSTAMGGKKAALADGQGFEDLSDKHLEQIIARPEAFVGAVKSWSSSRHQTASPEPVEATVEPEAATPDFSQHGWKNVKLEKVEVKEGVKKDGKTPWKRWAAYDGSDWYGTFSATVGAILERAKAEGKALWIRVKEEGDHLNIEEAWLG